MIETINDIDSSTEEGRLLIAALAKITTESQTDKEPDEVLAQVIQVARGIYNDEETAAEDRHEKSA